MQTFVRSEEPQWIELGGGQRRRIRAHNGEMMLVEVGFDTGAVGADHAHPHTQISYVLEGEFTYHIEGQTWVMKQGDSIVVDGGRIHGCSCTKAGTLLDVFAPMRADFVKEHILRCTQREK